MKIIFEISYDSIYNNACGGRMITIEDLKTFLDEKGYKYISCTGPFKRALRGEVEISENKPFQPGKWFVKVIDKSTGVEKRFSIRVDDFSFKIVTKVIFYAMTKRTNVESLIDDFSKDWRMLLLSRYREQYFEIVKKWINKEKGNIHNWYMKTEEFYLEKLEALYKSKDKVGNEEKVKDCFDRIKNLKKNYIEKMNEYDVMLNSYSDYLSKIKNVNKRKNISKKGR